MNETEKKIKAALPKIGSDFHKYDRGRLFMAAGSYGMAGALIMAAKAALRTGVGYLDIFVSSSIYEIAASELPEAVFCVYDPEDIHGAKRLFSERIKKADAVLFGPGLSDTAKVFLPEVLSSDKPLLVDADGLNALARYEKNVHFSGRDIVLTPHTGEAKRLLSGIDENTIKDRMKTAEVLHEKYGGTVLLKGPGTIIFNGEDRYINESGNASLARAGSGDVLSGIIASLMAQGEDGFHAALSGAYIHGKAAERLSAVVGIRSLLPTDILTILPGIIFEIESAEDV